MNVLLIDDDAFFRSLIGGILNKRGYKIVPACDGEDALRKIENNSFDLVITDLFMPNKEGLEIIKEIRAINPHIRIIAISSDALGGLSSFLNVALTFGANAALKKPFSSEQLIRTIEGLDDPVPTVRTAV